MLGVGGEDLVARPEVEPRQHLADALARRGRERDVGDVGTQHLGVAAAQRVLELEAALEVRVAAAVLELAGQLLRRGLLRGAGDRPGAARVEVRHAREDRVLVAQRVKGHGGGGYWPQTGQGDEPLREYSTAARRSCSASEAAAGLPVPPTLAHVACVNWYLP